MQFVITFYLFRTFCFPIFTALEIKSSLTHGISSIFVKRPFYGDLYVYYSLSNGLKLLKAIANWKTARECIKSYRYVFVKERITEAIVNAKNESEAPCALPLLASFTSSQRVKFHNGTHASNWHKRIIALALFRTTSFTRQ